MTMDMNLGSKLSDAVIERARKRIGEVTPITGGFNSEAQLDTIRHFAEGIGDDNPLWLDPEYAAKTQHGTLLAPPSYLLSCNQGPMWRGRTSGGFRGFTGVHRFWSSDAWEWFLPIKRGDSIRGESQLSEFIEHKSAMAGRTIEDIAIQKFYNQGDELIGTHRLHFINTERSTAAESNSRPNPRPMKVGSSPKYISSTMSSFCDSSSK